MGEDRYQHHFTVLEYLKMSMLIISLAGPFTCVLLIIGLCCDIKNMLLPWVVDTVLIIVFDLIYVVYIICQEYRNIDSVKALTITFDFFFLVLNIYVVLCVISQYQEYLEGRGTARDEGSRSPPIIRYSRRSTMNSGMDSTRRTVTFLEQGIHTNGISPTHNSQVSRAPSIIKKDDANGEKSNVVNSTRVHFGGPEKSRITSGSKKHVQFPAETIEESEPSEGETCAIITAKNEVKTRKTLHPMQSSILLPKDREGKNNTDNSPTIKETTKERQICLSSPKELDATPLIKSESPEEVARY